MKQTATFDRLADLLSDTSKRDPVNAEQRRKALAAMNETQLRAFAELALAYIEQTQPLK